MAENNEIDQYGLPLKVSRQWLEEHSEPDEFAAVPIPERYQDGLFTHAEYEVPCTCKEVTFDCPCSEDPNATWELASYSG